MHSSTLLPTLAKLFFLIGRFLLSLILLQKLAFNFHNTPTPLEVDSEDEIVRQSIRQCSMHQSYQLPKKQPRKRKSRHPTQASSSKLKFKRLNTIDQLQEGSSMVCPC